MLEDNIIREIPLEVYSWLHLPSDAGAWVFHDTENRALQIKYKDTSTHFNIEWLEKDEEKVNWLSQVIIHAMQQAYESGAKEVRREIAAKLSGIKELINT